MAKKRRKIKLLDILIIFILLPLISSLFIKEKSIKNIMTRTNIQNSGEQAHKGKELQIGDIVYYNHELTKVGDKFVPVSDDKLNLSFDKGNAEVPGTGTSRTQTVNAKGKKIVWKVWDVNKITGEVTLISDETIPLWSAQNAIGYIWLEYNMHRAASAFGYGFGANTKMRDADSTSIDKDFIYKVGSGLENTGDTARWKIGGEPSHIEKINKSGTRALALKDIEDKLGITEEKIKANSATYGDITKVSICFPQRKAKEKNINQSWEDESIAKSSKQEVEIRNEYYNFRMRNLLENTNPYSKLIKKGIFYIVANNTIDSSKSSNIKFTRPRIEKSNIISAFSRPFIGLNSKGEWGKPSGENIKIVLLTFMDPKIEYYEAKDHAPSEGKAWDIVIPESKEKNIELKVNNLTENAENIKYTFKQELENLSQDVNKAPEVLNALGKQITTKNTSVNIYSGTARVGKLKEAVFSEVHNKYKVEITEISENNTYKVIGADENGYIDVSKTDSIEIAIYPKPKSYTVPIEYVGGEKAGDFTVSGKLKLMNGNTLLGEQDVVLDHHLDQNQNKYVPDITNITFLNIPTFDETKNELINQDESKFSLEFVKETGIRHEVTSKHGKLVVTYVPEPMEINILAKSENGEEIKLNEIVVNLVKKIGEKETEEEVVLEKGTNFTKKITVPKTDISGNVISYSLKEKKGSNSGYTTKINKFEVTLVPRELPYTGNGLNLNGIIIILGICVLYGVIFRPRKDYSFIFKSYSIMK